MIAVPRGVEIILAAYSTNQKGITTAASVAKSAFPAQCSVAQAVIAVFFFLMQHIGQAVKCILAFLMVLFIIALKLIFTQTQVVTYFWMHFISGIGCHLFNPI